LHASTLIAKVAGPLISRVTWALPKLLVIRRQTTAQYRKLFIF